VAPAVSVERLENVAGIAALMHGGEMLPTPSGATFYITKCGSLSVSCLHQLRVWAVKRGVPTVRRAVKLSPLINMFDH
jgi:hypothetical protein